MSYYNNPHSGPSRPWPSSQPHHSTHPPRSTSYPSLPFSTQRPFAGRSPHSQYAGQAVSSDSSPRKPKGSLPTDALLFTPVAPKNIGVPYHQQNSSPAFASTVISPQSLIQTDQSFSNPHITGNNFYQSVSQENVFVPPSQFPSQPGYPGHPHSTQTQQESNQSYYQSTLYAGQHKFTQQTFDANASHTTYMPNMSAPTASSTSEPMSWESIIATSNALPSSSSRSTHPFRSAYQSSAPENGIGLKLDRAEMELASLWDLAVNASRKADERSHWC